MRLASARVILSEGLEQVFERHRSVNAALRAGLEAMELKLLEKLNIAWPMSQE